MPNKPAESQGLTIIYLTDGRMLVSRKVYTHWREIQDEYDTYQTSLGPWPLDEVVDFIKTEYPDKAKSRVEAITQLTGSRRASCELP